MRARTIGQIASRSLPVISVARPVLAESAPVPAQAKPASAVDLDAISDEEIARCSGAKSDSKRREAIEDAKR
jgi:hypothetical protein